ncbi:YceK/YidQ family lipoprotein [Pseudomonas sp. GXM4]|nr:YceK/YidQ family lipoprotein [Pseudomonas sp. GXM4]
MSMKKMVTLSVLFWVLSGCGSVSTVLQADADAARDLRKKKTYCQSIPRIYSGVAFDFCTLNAPPDPAGMLAPFVLFDLPLSAVFDTLSLPYTVYRQITDSNLSIYWRKDGY